MNEAYILDSIRQRMAELGYTNYHWEAVKITYKDAIEPTSAYYFDYASYTPFDSARYQVKTTEFNISAHNQYYFLVSKTLDPKLTIVADNEILSNEDANSFSDTSFFQIKDFTGQIFFKTTGSDPINIEFIKCTPNQ